MSRRIIVACLLLARRVVAGTFAGVILALFAAPAVAQPSPVNEYQYAVRAHVARFQYGPRSSVHGNPGGRVEVGIKLDPRGRLLHAAVIRSSCSEAQEQAALATVRAANPFPVMAGPPAARAFSVIVIFQPITRTWQYRMPCTPGGQRKPVRE